MRRRALASAFIPPRCILAPCPPATPPVTTSLTTSPFLPLFFREQVLEDVEQHKKSGATYLEQQNFLKARKNGDRTPESEPVPCVCPLLVPRRPAVLLFPPEAHRALARTRRGALFWRQHRAKFPSPCPCSCSSQDVELREYERERDARLAADPRNRGRL